MAAGSPGGADRSRSTRGGRSDRLARDVERRGKGLATSKWWKEERQGVFLDYNQNAKDRTVASAYSVRPVPDGRVSAPLSWDEVDDADPEDFTLGTMAQRFAKIGDRHAGIDASAGSLDNLLELSARQEKEGQGDAPWPPHYRKQTGEPPRVQPSKARRVPKFPLIVAAVLRLLVGSPAQKNGWMPEALPLHVIVLDLADPLDSQRLPREILPGTPAALPAGHTARVRLDLRPLSPWMTVQRGLAQRCQLFHQLLAHRHRKCRGDADVLERARVVVEPKEEGADGILAALVPAES